MQTEKVVFDLSFLLTRDNSVIQHLRTVGIVMNFFQSRHTINSANSHSVTDLGAMQCTH